VAFVIYPATAVSSDGMATTDAVVVTTQDSADVVVERNGGKTHGRGRGGVSDEKAVATTPVWREIDFDNVVNYRLEKSSNGKHIHIRNKLITHNLCVCFSVCAGSRAHIVMRGGGKDQSCVDTLCVV